MDILTVSRLTKIYGEGGAATAPGLMCPSTWKRASSAIVLELVGLRASRRSCTSSAAWTDLPPGPRAAERRRRCTRVKREPAVFQRREVGLVYQFYNLVPVLSGGNMTRRLDGRAVNAGRLQVSCSGTGSARWPRGHLAASSPARASSGHQPGPHERATAVVLADEPTGNLDTRNSCRDHAASARFNREFEARPR